MNRQKPVSAPSVETIPGVNPVQRLGVVLAHLAPPCQPSPEGSPGRPAHRPFRGLLGVHSRCSLHTRAVTVFRDPLSEGFRHFVSSMPAPVAFRLERIAGWGLHPLESAALSRRTPIPAIRGTTIEPPEPTHLRPSWPRQRLVLSPREQSFGSDLWSRSRGPVPASLRAAPSAPF